tara:strand:- start:60 stop:422 length:363 start_codon:yes stop_codon:yes gene_type:complete
MSEFKFFGPLDPFTGKPVTQADIDAQVASYGQDDEENDDPFVEEPDSRRTLQQTQMVYPDRQAALREAKKKSNIQKSEPKSGLSAGAAGRGVTTGGLKTYGDLSGSGGFGKQTKVNPARR